MNENVNSFGQQSDEILIREPGSRTYQVKQGPELVALAETLWEYAVLCENIYFGDWIREGNEWRSLLKNEVKLPSPTPSNYGAACVPGERAGRLPLPGWTFWSNFPSQELARKAQETGLYVEVWEKTSSGKRTIAAIFKGTQSKSWRDWLSNLRWSWYLVERFIPSYRDQYTVIAKSFGNEFVEEFIRRRYERSSNVSIIAGGHSLGGGLAQEFAYSLPLHPDVPRVSHVCAFDPSPVTGWYSVDKDVRTRNALELTIDRVFEHGEILAYLRLLLSYLYPPSASKPSIREIRVNFVSSWNFLTNHGMRSLVCGLLKILKKYT
jgi:hypothetical protein